MLFSALLEKPDRLMRVIYEREKMPVDRLLRALVSVPPENIRGASPVPRAATGSRSPALDQFCKDYTALARDGKLPPVIGRRREIRHLMRGLPRKNKNNPLLVGEPGVGKTSIVGSPAQRIASGNVPIELRGVRIVELPLASLIAGAEFRGVFEQRLQQIIGEAAADSGVVLFIDEIHTIVGAGAGRGALDAATILKPPLARGAFRCIGATTPAEFRVVLQSDPALDRRFQFDDGRLTDGSGRVADFRHAIIILTSNLLTRDGARAPLGFGLQAGQGSESLREALLEYFRPEWLNRIREIVVFEPLGPQELRSIIDRIVTRIRGRLTDQGIDLVLSTEARDLLGRLGYDPASGAREVERVIDRAIVQPLATCVLEQRVARGGCVRVVAREGAIELQVGGGEDTTTRT